MANETLIAKLEQNLRQSRGARTRLSARLTELETEADLVRAELAEMDTLAGQTEAAIFRLLSNVMSGPATQVGTTSVGQLEVELERRIAQAELSQSPQPLQVPLFAKISGPPPECHALTMYFTTVPTGCAGIWDRHTSVTVGFEPKVQA